MNDQSYDRTPLPTHDTPSQWFLSIWCPETVSTPTAFSLYQRPSDSLETNTSSYCCQYDVHRQKTQEHLPVDSDCWPGIDRTFSFDCGDEDEDEDQNEDPELSWYENQYKAPPQVFTFDERDCANGRKAGSDQDEIRTKESDTNEYDDLLLLHYFPSQDAIIPTTFSHHHSYLFQPIHQESSRLSLDTSVATWSSTTPESEDVSSATDGVNCVIPQCKGISRLDGALLQSDFDDSVDENRPMSTVVCAFHPNMAEMNDDDESMLSMTISVMTPPPIPQVIFVPQQSSRRHQPQLRKRSLRGLISLGHKISRRMNGHRRHGRFSKRRGLAEF